MLVLTRKASEWVDISGPCRLKVVEICQNKVRLGFDAPASTNIARLELLSQLADNAPAVPQAIEGLATSCT